MTPRERVLSAIHHKEPDRVPFSWGLGITPEMASEMESYCRGMGYGFADSRRETEDIYTISPDYVGPPLPKGTDYWGVRRAAVSYAGGVYEEIEHYPLAAAQSPADLADYPWPTADWFDFASLSERVQAADPDRSRAHRAGIPISGNPLERYTWLTGLEQTLVNLLAHPDLVHYAMQRITDFFLDMMKRAVAVAGDSIDIFYFADDLGGQNSLLMSRETYREMIRPYHEQLMRRSKELLPASKAMFHTDGAVFEIIPDLIDAGVDILEAVQTDAVGMDSKRLKETFGDRLCFHGGIPVQSLLPNSTPDEVRERCRMLVRVFGRGGGYVAAPSHAVQYGTPVENVVAMLDTVLGEEDYAAAVSRARRR